MLCAELLVSKERKKHFTLLADQAQKRSPCILLTFFKIGVANNDSFDRGVLDLSVGLWQLSFHQNRVSRL